MVDTGIQSERELGISDFLRARARAATDSRIALDVSVGVVAVIVAAALRPELWLLLASAGLCLACFGLWAATVRIGSQPSRSPRLDVPLTVARHLISALGLGAAISTGFFLWAMLMGTWIS